jgi:glycosyltransferase involved in cell wall biosynthesis
MLQQNPSKMKLALMINMIAPARLPLYSGLAERFNLLVLHGGTESNRDSWLDMEKKLPNARVSRAWGWQFRIPRKVNGTVFDYQYIHVNPGLLWELLRFRPDAVISNEMGLRTVLALFYGTLFRRPVWVWWGGTVHTERKAGLFRKALRLLISRWARHWISYGHTSTAYLIGLKIPSSRIVEVQNGVDERIFESTSTPEFDIRPKPVLLCVGQLIARKGVDLLLDAAACLQREGETFSLLFVGSGPDKQVFGQRVKDLQLSNVHFLSSRTPENMSSVYRSADALIFPTLEDVWGLVANEAILCGLPVLCSKYAGCAEELFTEQSIFDPKDPAEFVAKLRQAVRGELPRPMPWRLVSTPHSVERLASAVENSVAGQALPVANVEYR